MENLEIIKRQDFLIYQDDNGVSRVNVRFEGDDVWLTAEQLTELFDASQQNISHHINQIYAEGKLDENRTHKKYLLVLNPQLYEQAIYRLPKCETLSHQLFAARYQLYLPKREELQAQLDILLDK